MADLCPSSTHTPPPGGGRCPCGAVTLVPASFSTPIRMGPTVAGHCPMGCGTTLFLGVGGHVLCSRVNCRRPGAVDELLVDTETEHLVRFGDLLDDGGFTIRHPLRERLDDGLFECALHDHLANLGGPPPSAARGAVTWRAVDDEDGLWLWSCLGTELQS